MYNVGPTSKMLGRRCTNVIQMFCVCWGIRKIYIYIMKVFQRTRDVEHCAAVHNVGPIANQRWNVCWGLSLISFESQCWFNAGPAADDSPTLIQHWLSDIANSQGSVRILEAMKTYQCGISRIRKYTSIHTKLQIKEQLTVWKAIRDLLDY